MSKEKQFKDAIEALEFLISLNIDRIKFFNKQKRRKIPLSCQGMSKKEIISYKKRCEKNANEYLRLNISYNNALRKLSKE